jgi:hypothetical protein
LTWDQRRRRLPLQQLHLQTDDVMMSLVMMSSGAAVSIDSVESALAVELSCPFLSSYLEPAIEQPERIGAVAEW